MIKTPIKIASRTSPLAVWQTTEVQNALQKYNINSDIKLVESTGDIKLNAPIYALGISGVFTKELDVALLNNEVDIAVHSLKDVPTELAKGLIVAAVLPRANPYDILLYKNLKNIEDKNLNLTIATSSLRRKAQWLKKFPNHHIVPIRGNVQTRLKKFTENKNIDGVIFAHAGLDRMNLISTNSLILDWMIPAPAQGIIGIVCRENDRETFDICQKINHSYSFQMAYIERQFMNYLQGGCSVPISALSKIEGHIVYFKGSIHSFDGKISFHIHKEMPTNKWQNIGREAATELLQQENAKDLMEYIKTNKPI